MPDILGISMTVEFLVPFLFILAIVFGSLQLAKIFKNMAVNAIIGIAIAFFAASYGPLTIILWGLLPSIVWFFIAMFFILFLFTAFGIRGRKSEHPAEDMVLRGGVLFVLLAVGWQITKMVSFEIPYIGSGENLIFIIAIVLILAIFWAAFKYGHEDWISKEQILKARQN